MYNLLIILTLIKQTKKNKTSFHIELVIHGTAGKLHRPISIQESVLWSAACYVLKPCHAICSPLVPSKYPSFS